MTIEVDTPAVGVARLRLADDRHRNALSLARLSELVTTLDDLDRDGATRCIVLTGQGRSFSAGLDLSALDGISARRDPVAAQNLQERVVARVSHPMRLATPVIAAVNGVALGAGLALALSCDVRLAARSAMFTTGTTRLGLSGCDMGLSWLLPRCVGAANAFDLMLTSRDLPGGQALRMGLVSRLTKDEELEETAVAVGGEIASSAPHAIRLTKQAMWANLATPGLAEAMALENRNQVLALMTDDAQSRIAAVRSRRSTRPADDDVSVYSRRGEEA